MPFAGLLNDTRVRAFVLQLLAFAGVVAFVAWIVSNTGANLDRLGMGIDFGFLDDRAGFNIVQTPIPYTNDSTYFRAFLVGLVNTLIVSALGIVLATIVGFAIGIGRLSSNWLLARLCTVYVETIRNVPLLLQVVFWFEAVLVLLPRPQAAITLPFGANINNRGLYLPAPAAEPALWAVAIALLLAIVATVVLARWARRRQAATGKPFPIWTVGAALILLGPLVVFLLAGSPVRWEVPVFQRLNFTGGIVIIPELAALLVALSLYTAAFIAEVVRAGVLAVPRGQLEAAGAIGLPPGLTMRKVVIPQALRVITPPLTNQYLNLIKNSSLAVAIGYPDLVGVFKNTVLNQTGRAIEVIGITMAVYLFISLVTALAMNLFNARVALRER
ncbi:MAG: amino acid ABC transporter permease [Bauldia sp.]|nr:amino acid ABC transporter permease [Bauldia sp.]